jgi:hypothetical protein
MGESETTVKPQRQKNEPVLPRAQLEVVLCFSASVHRCPVHLAAKWNSRDRALLR